MILDAASTQASPDPSFDLERLVQKIRSELPQPVPERRVREVATEMAARFTSARVTAFVPIFVQRLTSERLRQELERPLTS